jgi:hypothetical protein
MKKYILLAIPALFAVACESFDMEAYARLDKIKKEEGKSFYDICITKEGFEKIKNGGVSEYTVGECSIIYHQHTN